ncbi:hypothetical protein [Cumulibacter soli]|uniref:hypothetical protein n=1 Tax=Cumulibacter soli TaxID=2546344 RepID=UPI001068C5AE|nr:hypothetical protein [Cumulibacter soli]
MRPVRQRIFGGLALAAIVFALVLLVWWHPSLRYFERFDDAEGEFVVECSTVLSSPKDQPIPSPSSIYVPGPDGAFDVVSGREAYEQADDEWRNGDGAPTGDVRTNVNSLADAVEADCAQARGAVGGWALVVTLTALVFGYGAARRSPDPDNDSRDQPKWGPRGG